MLRNNFFRLSVLSIVFTLIFIMSTSFSMENFYEKLRECERTEQQLHKILEFKKLGLTESDAAYLYLFIDEKLSKIGDLLDEKKEILNNLIRISISSDDPESDPEFSNLTRKLDKLNAKIANLELDILREIEKVMFEDKISFDEFLKKSVSKLREKIGFKPLKMPSIGLPDWLEKALESGEKTSKLIMEKAKINIIHITFKSVVTEEFLNTLKIIGKVEGESE